MEKYPAWKDMSDDQKLEFLHEWCQNLSAAVQGLGADVQNFHRRLQALERKDIPETKS